MWFLITARMYNTYARVLKAWFDQNNASRVKTFPTFDLCTRGFFPLKPLCQEKTLVLLTHAVNLVFGAGGVREHMNHLSPHIKRTN